MKVRDVMIRQVVTISPETTYEEAARILYGNNVSGAPVVDVKGDLVGILSEKDLFRAMFPLYEEYLANPEAYRDQEEQEKRMNDLRYEPIKKFMRSPVVTVDANAPILRAGGLLLANGLHRLPVVERGKLVGIVTRENIFRRILQRRLFALMEKVDKKHSLAYIYD